MLLRAAKKEWFSAGLFEKQYEMLAAHIAMFATLMESF